MKKICKRCGQELPIENFAKNARSKDGYMHICNECMSKALKAGFAAAKDHKQAESVIELPAETVVVGTTTPDHAETMQAIEKSHESLEKTIAESEVQNEKIHQLTLKALELFDDEALIQALRDRGFSIINGELHKKFSF